MINDIASTLLYVPFNKDYTVSDIVKNTLSETEFFKRCFVSMDINKEINDLKGIKPEEFEEGEEDVLGFELKREKMQELKKIKSSIINFNRWIKDSGNAIYCIKGNAGCGKSTYLHYLKYTNQDESIMWDIIDIQKSREGVDVLNKKLQIPKFQMLDYKVIASMLDNILYCIFIRDENDRFNFEFIKERLFKMYKKYKDKIQEDFPNKITKLFFDDSPLFNTEINGIQKRDIEEYANNIYNYIKILINNESPYIILSELWSVYMCILNSVNDQVKHIIAFDNFERFIGSDEICNKQLWDFIELLRHLLQSCEEADREFYQHFQIILFMRNTTSRMGNLPLQLLDFGGHELDLTDWFPINRIIDKKLKWYRLKDIKIPKGDLMDMIIGNASFDGRGIRSLQTRLNLLFNSNKRTLVTVLSEIIADDSNIEYLDKFYIYAKDKRQSFISLNKFAGRTIIIRLVLDWLQKDHFFKNIFVEDEEESYFRIGITRKILTILHIYSLRNNQGYMPFDEMIREFRNEGKQSIDRYFDANYKIERSIISKILYHMNYYNSREDEWLQFIDMQYNVGNGDMFFYVEDNIDLEKMICNHHSEIGIKIMPAGRAYLQYIVQSFEYFACRRKKGKIAPLLTLIPEADELDSCSSEIHLKCLDAIDKVFEDVSNCIEQMRGVPDNERIVYKRTISSVPKKHDDRIIDSQIGYINNFQQCIRKKYESIFASQDYENIICKLYEELDDRKRKYERLREI